MAGAETREASVVARLAADATAARALLDKLADIFDPEQAAVSAYDAGGNWSVDIHFLSPPNETAVRALVGLAVGTEAANALTFERVAPQDWVKASLDGLPPVAAGRFVVHGAHDRAAVAVNRIGIEIEAALAFGTGHHGTTKGCLLALDGLIKGRKQTRSSPPPERTGLSHGHRRRSLLCPRPACGERAGRWCHAKEWVRGTIRSGRGVLMAPLTRSGIVELFSMLSPQQKGVHARLRRAMRGEGAATAARRGYATASPFQRKARKRRHALRRILDLGTGTGVLGIAAARTLRSVVLASDMDPRCVEVARENARHNCTTSMIVIRASGLTDRRFRERGPFDLVLANILLGPLQKLAAPMARLAAPGGYVVLSGLLAGHAHAALAAYRVQGFVLIRRIALDGWTTLVLQRPKK